MCEGSGCKPGNTKDRPELNRSWEGAEGQNRTADTAIFSRMLYRLSYLGLVGGTGLEPVTSSV